MHALCKKGSYKACTEEPRVVYQENLVVVTIPFLAEDFIENDNGVEVSLFLKSVHVFNGCKSQYMDVLKFRLIKNL